MSKAFITENESGDDADSDADLGETRELPPGVKNYITPAGFATLQDELQRLTRHERPKIVEIVSWAAGNGDRSENGDYIYGKKRLREIDRRIRHLTRRLEAAEVVDPRKQQNLDRVFFGATVDYARADGSEHRVRIVGVDEIDLEKNKISWRSALALALMKTKPGDTVEVRTAGGTETIEVLDVSYPLDTP